MVNSHNFPAPPPPPTNFSSHLPPPPPANLSSHLPPAPPRNVTVTAAPKVVYPLPAGQPNIDDLLKEAFDAGFSDLHVGVGEIPRFRNRGEIETTEYPETDYATFMSWIHQVLSEKEVETFQQNLDFDGATQYDFARIRIKDRKSVV